MSKKLILVLVIVVLILGLSYLGFTFIHNQNTVYKSASDSKYSIDDLTNAVLINDLELVEKITNDKVIDINQKDSNGKFPLEMVLVMENCEMAELLLKNGGNPYVITTSGRSIYEIVMNNSNKMLKEIFKEKEEVQNYNKYNVDQLSQAVLENDIDTVNKIIESETVDINQKDSNGIYPLEMVLVMNNCDMAKILLRVGADPQVATENGKTIYELVMNTDNKALKEIFKNTSN